ncbi:hypothetical protein KSP35_13025 [Aquihabitans sp. G128]|uniref:hypothetical protein n=1 Tax=Aquihabitans sp. G128 TaxID=2849779 RepID=UPI001C2222A3|nr:hypothetical protein [Aquihabitans sp. G128]QXC59325.1 hypothetical protein KSP35_13025 [Aquihabitans sp. G128]
MSNAYLGSYNDWVFGNSARPGASVRSLSGFFGKAADIPTTDRWDIGATAGTVRVPVKGPRLGLNLHAESRAQLDDLILTVERAFPESMAPLPLTIGGWSMWAQVASCQPDYDPSWPGPEKNTPCDIAFTAVDPVLYSAETVITRATPAGTQTLPLDNVGSRTTKPGRALTLAITAVTNCANVYIEAGGRRTTWNEYLLAGQTLTLDAGRISRIGSQRIDGKLRGNNLAGLMASKAPRWPRIPPGESTVTVGAQFGTFTVVAKHRSTR